MHIFFRFIYRTQQQKQNSKLKALFLLSIGILQILINISSLYKFHLNRELELMAISNIKYYETTNTLLKFFSYFDVEYFCQQQVVIVLLLLLMSFFYPFLFSFFMILGYESQKQNDNKHPISLKILGSFTDIYFWCFFQLFIQIALETITMNKQLLDWNSVYNLHQITYYFLISVAIISLITNIFTAILIILFFSKNVHSKYDQLSCQNTQIMFDQILFKIMLALFDSIEISSKFQYLVYNVGLELLLMKCLYNQFFGNHQPSFTYNWLNYLYQHYLFSLLAVLFVFLGNYLLSFQNYQIESLAMLLIFILFFNLLGSIIEKKIELYFLLKKCDNSSNLLNKLYYFKLLYRRETNHSQVIIGLLIKHLREGCISKAERKFLYSNDFREKVAKNDSIGYCYCSQHQFYDAKRKLYINCTSSQVNLNYKSFCKVEIKSWYEQFILLSNKSYVIRLQYAYYLFTKMKNTCLALRQFTLVSQQYEKLTFLEKLHFNLMMIHLKIIINNKNQTSYRGRLNFENVIQLEKAINKIKAKILDIILHYLKFWKCLNCYEIDEAELIKQDVRIRNNVAQCEESWKTITNFTTDDGDPHPVSYLNKKSQWEMLHLWYRRYILNQKLKNLKFEYHNYNHIQENFIEEDSDSDYESNILMSLDPKKIFHTQTAILFAYENGKIFQSNEYARKIFGISALQNISQLIHPVMVRNHMYRIKEFVETGRCNSVYSRRKILFQHYKQHLMIANKYLKISINQNMFLDFIAMIRPINHEQSGNYILVNEDWEVVETTKQLQNIFHKQFNLLLLCPKLLLYSPFRYLLEKDDYKLFQIDSPEQNLLSQQHTLQSLKTLYQQKTLMDNVFDDIDQEKQFTDQFIKENEDDLEERQRIFNINMSNKNEQYFYLLIKIPMLYQKMQAEYFNLITNGDKENFYDFPEDSIIKKQSIIVRSGPGGQRKDLSINFQILNEKLQFLKKVRLNAQLDVFRYLYRKYFYRAEQLKKVIRIEAKIKYEAHQQIDKIQIIKVNRYETFNNLRSKKQSMLLKGNIKKKTLNIQFQEKKIDLPLPQIPSLKDTQTNTDGAGSHDQQEQQQYLVSEAKIKGDFNNSNSFSHPVEPDQNLFIKEEHNKMKKHFNKIDYFKWTNRYFMVGMILLTMMSFSYGPVVNYQKLFELGVNSSYSFVQMQNGVAIVYNLLVDVALCNKNETYCSNLVSYKQLSNSQLTGFELINSDLEDILLEHNQLYESMSSIKVIFSINVSQHAGEFHPNNLIEDIQTFSVVLKQFLMANKFQINFDNQFLEIMQKDLMPALFESMSYVQTVTLSNTLDELQFRQKFFLFDMISGFMFLGTLMCINIYNVFQIIDRYQVLHSQLQYFDQFTIDSVISYYQRMKQHFNYLNDIQTQAQSNHVSFQSEGLIKVEGELQIILAVKTTKFKLSSYWFQKKLKYTVLYLVFMMFLIVMAFTYNLYMQKFALDLKNEIVENPFLTNIYNPWAFIFSKELQIESIYDIHNIITNEYQEYLQDFVNIAIFDKADIYNSNHESINNYFYSDICEILNTDCGNLNDGILKRGLIQTYYLIGTLFQSQLNENTTAISDVSFDSIYKYNRLQPYLFQVNSNMWKIWIEKFNSIFQYYLESEIQLIICFYIFSFLIYITTLEIYFEQRLRNDYLIVREFYKRYFPNEALNQQKRIKALLKKLSLL